MISLPENFKAIVIGTTGGIGSAVADRLEHMKRCGHIERVSRKDNPGFDLLNETSIGRLASALKRTHGDFHLIFDATGALEIAGKGPEKSLAAINLDSMSQAFAVNVIGPSLLFKHFTPLLPTEGKCVFATLSARVGSIGDNRLGGWYAYRASKAALNQIVKTASIEIGRRRPQSVCLALHPGTVETSLSRRYAKNRFTHAPQNAAEKLIEVMDRKSADVSGGFFDYEGREIIW